MVLTDHHCIDPIPSAQGRPDGTYWPSLNWSHPICTGWSLGYLLAITELIPSHLHRVDLMALTDHHWIDLVLSANFIMETFTVFIMIKTHYHDQFFNIQSPLIDSLSLNFKQSYWRWELFGAQFPKCLFQPPFFLNSYFITVFVYQLKSHHYLSFSCVSVPKTVKCCSYKSFLWTTRKISFTSIV